MQGDLHFRREHFEALSREDDWPGGQSDLPLGALGREGLPGLEVGTARGSVSASSPMALSRAAVVTVNSMDAIISGIHRGLSMSHRLLSRN